MTLLLSHPHKLLQHDEGVEVQRLAAPDQAGLRAALASELLVSAHARFMHRLHALLQVSLGQSCYEVALQFGEHPRSIERWLHRFATNGASGLREGNHPGRTGQLSPLQRGKLQRELRASPLALNFRQARWTGKLVARHLEESYQVTMGLRCCQRLLQESRSAVCAPAATAEHGAGA